MKIMGIKAIDLTDEIIKEPDLFNDFLCKIEEEEDYLKIEKEIHSWVGFNPVHQLIFDLYKNKNGFKKDFTMVKVPLTETDLKEIEKNLKNKEFPEKTNKIWGEPDYSKEVIEDALSFVQKSLKNIKKGYTIYYEPLI